ncbi:hypothetical protein BDP81DRAFT_437716 [Colletotrichum phormii]|uniref:Uncharacterized protein n=1 Tax=Colletotrichum phormii TaxID=359342 RepID=A0AAJ0EAD8_9PEZI|nr:uncharacterized protein BDP81DRAFT_437716 [Colletotrichum phormii]KAK1624511.1 hypothetical protein BDP81DRAFT_437716 [Colletotrichum phormii]
MICLAATSNISGEVRQPSSQKMKWKRICLMLSASKASHSFLCGTNSIANRATRPHGLRHRHLAFRGYSGRLTLS